MERNYLSDNRRNAYGKELHRVLASLTSSLDKSWEWKHSLELTDDRLITTFGLRPTIGGLGDLYGLPSFNKDDGFILGEAESLSRPHATVSDTLTQAVSWCIEHTNIAILAFPDKQLGEFYTHVAGIGAGIRHMTINDIQMPFRNSDNGQVFSYKYAKLLEGICKVFTKLEIGLVKDGFYLSTTNP